ncbi:MULTISPECIES: tripartite tricarboxylate transporter substrate binding protein [Cupriavidus]|uniref:tripartite tricarboxylate transporter substrate binding protein n=1 Tax=Cupriavidus TaxID=106589 RepID=UPI00048E9B30|nr:MULTISPECIES: tripartite tricarboxylate transporter substrate binding protein [Cupriavidus]
MQLRSRLGGVVLSLCALLCAAPARAWPDKPIELVVGFAAGGGTDLTARALASFLGKALGASVVVVNKPGAAGGIGLAYVARARPDGYTLGMTNMPGLVTLPIERNAGFGAGDFTYLATLVRDPSAFSVSRDSPYKTLAELIAAAKKDPGAISYGSTGSGTDDHLAMVMFEGLTGTQLNHVPFNGAGPMRNALMGGHTVIAGMNLGEALPYDGRTVRILAQASAGRSKLAPAVPSFREQGVDLVFASERGVVAPRGLPSAVEKQLGAALRQVALDPAFQQMMKTQFTEMDYLPGPEWKQRLDGAEAGFRRMWAAHHWIE